MEVIKKIPLMQELSDEWRINRYIVACVPTMGFLHQGHIELLRVGREKGDRLIMTLFINPTQFGPQEDYEKYPQDTMGDLNKARSAGVDAVFMPTAEEMYPEGFQSTVAVNTITQHLCGKSRPSHFAIVGEKDYQQLAVIRQIVKDLNMDIDIIGIPTVREHDGLAMSSRNKYLSPGERLSALSLKKGLDLAKTMVRDGEKDSATIKNAVKKLILAHPYTTIDYVTICDPADLTNVQNVNRPSLLALAVKVGKAGLIDNSIIA